MRGEIGSKSHGANEVEHDIAAGVSLEAVHDIFYSKQLECILTVNNWNVSLQ